MGHPTVRDGGASILGLQQIEVVGHGCRVAHDARVNSKAILVTCPRQLGKINMQIDRLLIYTLTEDREVNTYCGLWTSYNDNVDYKQYNK